MNNDNTIRPSYNSEEINNLILETNKHSNLLFFYLYYIRNYKELTYEMLEKIVHFDDNHKMIIIKEYNKVIKSLHSILLD